MRGPSQFLQSTPCGHWLSERSTSASGDQRRCVERPGWAYSLEKLGDAIFTGHLRRPKEFIRLLHPSCGRLKSRCLLRRRHHRAARSCCCDRRRVFQRNRRKAARPLQRSRAIMLHRGLECVRSQYARQILGSRAITQGPGRGLICRFVRYSPTRSAAPASAPRLRPRATLPRLARAAGLFPRSASGRVAGDGRR